jgi:hypothetical protein
VTVKEKNVINFHAIFLGEGEGLEGSRKETKPCEEKAF